jgi:flagellar hook-associated protein 1 FlgK
MASLFSLMSVARDGVMAQTAALDVTGQNVAGANTPGYVRRTPVLESVTGGGVVMSGASRGFDRFTYAQLIDQSGRLSSATARATAISDVEALVTPGADHLGDRADALFNAFHELTVHPADAAVRSSVLSSAQWLASGFSETANGLDAMRGELATRAADVATEVNQRLTGIATLDKGIIEAKGRGEDASDLIDRRDQMVRDVADRVGARSVEGANGGITLFSGGTVLYEGGRAAQLNVSLDANGALMVQANRNGNMIDITSGIQTGTLAGVKQSRDVDIAGLQTSLDSYAKDIGDTINAIHVTGFALDGTTGRNLFAPSATVKGAAHAMALDPAIDGHPELLATASSATDLPGGNDIAAKLADLGRNPINGGATASERYAAIAGTVGQLRTTTDSEEAMRQDTVATATALRESASGVSTDEEMIHLQQYQRAFEASTRVLSTINTLFESVMGIIR